jgi:hypothetical protein
MITLPTRPESPEPAEEQEEKKEPEVETEEGPPPSALAEPRPSLTVYDAIDHNLITFDR